jgi:uncharacterized integral membrane protein
MKSLSLGQWVILIILVGILLGTGYFVLAVWNATDVAMDRHGWTALILGTVFSLVIGCGLMALMFFSSRSGYDEAADPFRNKQEPPTE